MDSGILNDRSDATVDGTTDVSMMLMSLHGGGIKRVFLYLARAFVSRGLRVEIIVVNPQGPFMKDIPEGVRIVTLERRGTDRDAKVPLMIRLLTLRADSAGFFHLARPVLLVRKTYPELHYLPDLVQKLRTSRPRIIISALPELNVLALWASRHVRPRPRVVVTEHSVHTPLPRSKRHGRWFKRFLPQVMYRTYGLADAIVAVSDGVGDDVAAFTGLPRERIQTIYNPVVPDTSSNSRRSP